MTTIHALNYSPISSVPDMTFHEAYLSTKPNISHFCIFGCGAYVLVLRKDCGKMDSSFPKMFFVGYNFAPPPVLSVLQGGLY